MSEPTFKFQLTPEGIAKRNAMRNIPLANQYQLTNWMTNTVEWLKRSAAHMQKSGKGKHSGGMSRNIGMVITATGGGLHGEVGTGVGKTQSIKYASIQDAGGLTKPEVTDKSRKFFWAMYFKTKDDKWKGMALTKKTIFNIFIPRSSWFSGVIDNRRAYLDELLSPANVLKVAEKMGAK